MEDRYVIQYINNYLKNHKYIKHIPDKEIINYLLIRYDDSLSINESYYRLIHNLNIRPVCPECGKPLKFLSISRGFRKFCSYNCAINSNITKEKRKNTCKEKYGSEYVISSKDVREKSKNTCIEKYGVEHVFQASVVKDKIKNSIYIKYGVYNVSQNKTIKDIKKHTTYKNYGVENPLQNEEIKNKIKTTCLQKYGVEHPLKSKDVQNKIKETCIEKYGSEHFFQSNIAKEKIKTTCLERYGVEHPSQTILSKENYKQTCLNKYGVTTTLNLPNCINKANSKESKLKEYNTKKLHNSFNKSKPEDDTYILLLEKYPDAIRQYRSELYPFNCDFYIPSKDLYIECNFMWTHGGHPYDTINDKAILELWKSKNTKFYNNAIVTWTVRDPLKRETAKKNNLNYIEFWNLQEVKDWIETR